MTLSSISLILWLVWVIIGFCGGYMTSRLSLGGRYAPFMSVAGMIGGVCGGLLFIFIVDNADEKMQLLSLIASVAGTALVVWPARFAVRPRKGDDDE